MDVTRLDEELQALYKRWREAPDNLDVLADLCYGANIRSHHGWCIQLARRGLGFRDNDARLYFELIIACSLDTAHVLDEILTELETLSASNPSDWRMMRNLALVHYFLEHDRKAEEILQEILAACPEAEVDAQTFEVLAQLEYTRQNIEIAIEHCDRAIDRPGPSARAIRLKGLCYQELEELDLARGCFRLALELEPHFIWACHSLGALYLDHENYAEAFRYFGKATFINPLDPGNLFLLAEAFIETGAYHLARAELDKLLMLKPEKRIEAEVHNALGYIYTQTDHPDAAERCLSHAIALEPELAVAHHNLGRAALLRGDLASADRHLRNAIEIDPKHAESWVELGFLRLREKRFTLAKESFGAALTVDPNDAQALLGLSKVNQKLRQPKKQLALAIEAFEIDPSHPEICNNLGISYECNKQFEEAEEAYLRALEVEPMHAAAANNLGHLYERLMKSFPDRREDYRAMAIEAWKQRLQICATAKKSTRAAKTHLKKMGVSQAEIEKIEQAYLPVGE